MTNILGLSLLILLLNGCISLKDDVPHPNLFLINPQDTENIEKIIFPYSFVVIKPKIKSGLNTDRIALIRERGRILDYFAEARWNGRLENVFQDFTIETLENNFVGASFLETGVDQKADFKLITRIHDFQAEYSDGNINSNPKLKVSFSLSVLRTKDNKMVFDFKIQEESFSHSNTLTDITCGLEKLTQVGFTKFKKSLVKLK